MKKSMFIISLVMVMFNTHAQTYLISFAGAGDTTAISTIKVDNLTSGATVTLNGGDVLHLFGTVGINALVNNSEAIRIYPNPMTDQSTLTFVAPESGIADVSMLDLSGRTLYQVSTMLSSGAHSFRLTGISMGINFVKITGVNYTYSAKLICQSNLQPDARIEYISSIEVTEATPFKSIATIVDMPYTDGDQLLFKGMSGQYSTVVPDVPVSSKTITFNFVLCKDSEGHTYATVQIGMLKTGAQVWMAENLNIGDRINGSLQQTNNDTLEKYCYNDLESNCFLYGGLYQWHELMQYDTTEGVQGICPAGWHVPSNSEYATLEGYLGGYQVAAGKMRKTGTLEAGTGLWYAPNTGATNISGFTAFPAGWRYPNGNFYDLNGYCRWWSSTQTATATWNAWGVDIYYNMLQTNRNSGDKNLGNSLRCLRD